MNRHVGRANVMLNSSEVDRVNHAGFGFSERLEFAVRRRSELDE